MRAHSASELEWRIISTVAANAQHLDATQGALYRSGATPLRPPLKLPLFIDLTSQELFAIPHTVSWLAQRYYWTQHVSPSWTLWRRRSAGPAPLPHYKLYLSVSLVYLEASFNSILASLIKTTEAFAFKFPTYAAAMTRPDRIICYYQKPDTLLKDAKSWKEELKGSLDATVPFAARSDSAAIYWGIDAMHPDGQMSWRTWVTRIIAQALLDAKQARLTGEDLLDSVAQTAADAGLTPSWEPNLDCLSRMGCEHPWAI